MERAGSGRGSAVAERVSSIGLLERPAQWVADMSERWRGPAADVLRGRPLGHALHPALTDLPIGFWTSAVVLDLAGGARRADAAQRLVALGVVSAVPTALAGFADVPSMEPPKRRVALVHAVSNTVALALFARSWWSRARGRRGAGIVDGLLASAVATFGGYLGGWMAFGQAGDQAAREALPTGDRGRGQPISRLTAVR